MLVRLFLASCVVWATVATAQDDTARVVEATGRGDGVGAASRDRAIDDALRNALAQAFGTFISSQSQTENFTLVHDRVFAEIRGLVAEFKVLSERVDNGITVVTVRATCVPSVFNARWEAIRQLIYRKQRPRMMFLLYELRHPQGEPVPAGADGFQTFAANAACARLEERFAAQKFFLVDRRQFLASKAAELDAARLEANQGRLISLARDLGAEVVVFGHIQSYSAGSSEIDGMTIYRYTVEITAKAVRADTAQIIASMARTYTGRSMQAMAAARDKAFVEADAGYGGELMGAILTAWAEDVGNATTVQLVVEGIAFAQVVRLQNALRQVEGIGQLSSRGFSGGTQVWDVESRLSAEDLAVRLSEIDTGIPLEVTGVQANRITVRVGR
jgi:hypothetical protein